MLGLGPVMDLVQPTKRVILHLCKGIGLFSLSRRLTRKKLQILCYHGFEIADETEFWPSMFISAALFECRLQFLKQAKFNVLPLDEAVRRLDDGTLPPGAVVITVDDGFYETLTVAAPLLKKYGYPATVYVPTYYVEKGEPVFRVALRYALWKSPKREVDLSSIAGLALGVVKLGSRDQRGDLCAQILKKVEDSLVDENSRQNFLREICRCSEVSYDDIVRDRKCTLVTPEQAVEMTRYGIDLQLHTHEHVFPANDQQRAELQIAQNRDSLKRYDNQEKSHFCYPSGKWDMREWPWLEAMGVKSATTCDTGMNDASTPRLSLHRFLDSQNVRPIEFESELYGFREVLRGLRRMLGFQPERKRDGYPPATKGGAAEETN